MRFSKPTYCGFVRPCTKNTQWDYLCVAQSPSAVMFTYLVANGDCRVGQAGVPGHADLHGDRLGEVVAHPVRHLHQHHSEANGQQEDPQEAPPQRTIHVDRRPQARYVDLAVSGFALFIGNPSLVGTWKMEGGPTFCALLSY